MNNLHLCGSAFQVYCKAELLAAANGLLVSVDIFGKLHEFICVLDLGNYGVSVRYY